MRRPGEELGLRFLELMTTWPEMPSPLPLGARFPRLLLKLSSFPLKQGTSLCHAGAQLACSSPEFSQNPELRLQVLIYSSDHLLDK